ncbi:MULTISPECIES: DsbA family protein [Mesorhizobium]|uniref:DsbA family protein n=1 Tax=Mesorhizobium TaxID=68287 RepID=UPI003D31C192
MAYKRGWRSACSEPISATVRRWAICTLVELAKEVGINAEEARTVLTGKAFADQVRADTQSARRLGLKGVLFFMIASFRWATASGKAFRSGR